MYQFLFLSKLFYDLDLLINNQTLPIQNQTNCCNSILQRFLSSNFFKIDSLSQEEHEEKQGKIAIRIYLFSLLLCVISVYLHCWPFSQETKINPTPSIDFIHDLYENNLSNLSYSCSEVAVPYSRFVSVEPQLHPICSKDFFSPILSKLNPNTSLELIRYYRIIISLCDLSKHII